MKTFGIVLILLIALGFAGILYHVVTGTPLREALRRSGGSLLCRVFGHRRRRDTVRKVGTTYSARCGSCGIRLTRDGREGEWQVMTLAPPTSGTVVNHPSSQG